MLSTHKKYSYFEEEKSCGDIMILKNSFYLGEKTSEAMDDLRDRIENLSDTSPIFSSAWGRKKNSLYLKIHLKEKKNPWNKS